MTMEGCEQEMVGGVADDLCVGETRLESYCT